MRKHWIRRGSGEGLGLRRRLRRGLDLLAALAAASRSRAGRIGEHFVPARLRPARGPQRATHARAFIAVLIAAATLSSGPATLAASAAGPAAATAHPQPARGPLSLANLARLARQVDHGPLPAGAAGLAAASGGMAAELTGLVPGGAAAQTGEGCRLSRLARISPALTPPVCAVTRAASTKPFQAGSAVSGGAPSSASPQSISPQSIASFEMPDQENYGGTPGVPVLSLPGTAGEMVRFEQGGDVALVSPTTGMTVWDRTPQSFYPDWHVAVFPPDSFGSRLSDPFISYSVSPVLPFANTPYAVGYVSGEPDPVVAVVHIVLFGGNMPAGSLPLPNSFVTLLDGRTGRTLWFHEYPGDAPQLAFAGGRLIVANTAGPGSSGGLWGSFEGGPPGTVSTLDGWSFATSGGSLSGSQAWSYTMHSPRAYWEALSQAGPGDVAAAWSDTPLGDPGVPDGHVVLLSAASGRVHWTVPTPAFVRSLAFDPARGQVVALEEADPTVTLSYSLDGLRIANGAVADQIVRDSMLAFDNIHVGDITGSGSPDWVLTEQPFITCPPILGNGVCLGQTQITAFTPGSQTPAWTAPLPDKEPFPGVIIPEEPYGLTLATTAAGTQVIAGSEVIPALPSPRQPLGTFTQDVEGLGAYSDLRAFSGAGGQLLWSQTGGDEVSAPYITAISLNGRPAVASVNQEQDIHVFAAADGTPVASAAMFAGGMWTAAAADVNRDRSNDLIMGGESGGVFALDGSRLADGPHVLWHTSLGAPVHQIQVVQLDKTGPPSLVVAATDKLAVLSLDGSVRYEVAFPGQFVWSFAAGDLGNGTASIVVPTNAVTALDGATGHQMWRYQPDNGNALFSNVAISGKGTVVTEHAVPPADFGPPGDATGQAAAGLTGATGTVAWQATAASPAGAVAVPQLYQGVVASPDIPGASGNGVALTWLEGPDSGLGNTEVDIRDADTGALLYSQRLGGTAPDGYATGPAFGLAACTVASAGPSIADIQPTGVTTQAATALSGECSAVASAQTGPSSSEFLMESLQGTEPQAAPGDYPLAGGPLTGLPDFLHNIRPSAVSTVPLGSTGAPNAVGLSYNWQATQDLEVTMGSFNFRADEAFLPAGVAVFSLPGQ